MVSSFVVLLYGLIIVLRLLDSDRRVVSSFVILPYGLIIVLRLLDSDQRVV